MLKIFMTLIMFVSISFSEILIYDNFKLNQTIEKTNLSEYKQIPSSKYKLGEGLTFEKKEIYNQKEMNKVLFFSNDKKLQLVFFYEKTDYLDEKELYKKPETLKVTKFAKATSNINNGKLFKKYNSTDYEDYKKDIKNDIFSFINIPEATGLFTSMFIIRNIELNNERVSDDHTGLTKIKSCEIVKAHKNCPKCQYIEGDDKKVSCGNLYIYHPLVK